MTSWIEVPAGATFGPTTLPYGIVSRGAGRPHVAVAIGDRVLSLAAAAGTGLLDDALRDEFGVVDRAVFDAPSLNPFLVKGYDVWHAVRSRLLELVAGAEYEPALRSALVPRAEVDVHLPIEVADYVDFYSFEEHAANVGRLFRPNQPPVMPNWHRLPVGYHGRAGTVVVSGTDIVRPSGQRLIDDELRYGPSIRLDIEAEVGFVVGTPSRLGAPVRTSDFERYVFGAVLVNDWSARDLQRFEQVPLGPFLGKSFATSISPWVVPLDALAAARVTAPAQDPAPADYLLPPGYGYDLSLAVDWNGTTVSRPPFAGMYWTPAQQLAHLTGNGARLRTGDLYASGTVSGPRPDGSGCFLELTWGGAEPVTLGDGSRRTFLEDGDTVSIRATAPGPDGTTVGLGEVTGTILPAR